MRKFLFPILCVFLALTAARAATVSILPQPQSLQMQSGEFEITRETEVYSDLQTPSATTGWLERLRKATGFSLKLRNGNPRTTKRGGYLLLTTNSAAAAIGNEGYELTVSSNSITLRANTANGIFYGGQTLLQLLPPEVYSSQPRSSGISWTIPSLTITDAPRFPWRGMMLDSGRHFFDKDSIKALLDEMALCKLNVFHWHLVDDQGWRLEIKEFPKLTEIGAWRNDADLKRQTWDIERHKSVTNTTPSWTQSPPSSYDSKHRYGGYYTQKDVEEIVAYASARHIRVVPEIELPGHSSAALQAYPEYSCFGGPYSTDCGAGVHDGIYNAADEKVFEFLGKILDETIRLFPDSYIHIGGDEVKKDYWNRSPQCLELMKREGLKTEAELQSWFIRRIEKQLSARGKKLVGWSEIRQGGLATNAIVMDWIGGGKEAALEGHDVVMTPTAFCYLNCYQSTNRNAEPHAQAGGFISLKKAWSFEPVPTGLPAEMKHHILGSEACLWTEWIGSLPHAEYMLFPRLFAFSETVWSGGGARNWNDFTARVAIGQERLKYLGVNSHPLTEEAVSGN